MVALRTLVILGAVSLSSSCGTVRFNDTLGYLDPLDVMKVAASSPAACCTQCVATPSCASWSWSGTLWTPSTPCHMSPYDFVEKESKPNRGFACGSARSPQPPETAAGTFIVDTSLDGRRQVFEGVEVELQSDSIGSHNDGMPKDGTLVPDDDPSALGAPHDLTPSERTRFATEVMMGVRTVRLALGLFLRGSPDNKSIVGRWPSQMAELKALQDASGIEGWAPEYWSPPPGWKSNNSYYGGTLASFSPAFLSSFADSVVRDVKYLQANGLRVTWWGLQNEPTSGGSNVTCPPANETQREAFARTSSNQNDGVATRKANSYAQCRYTQCDYYYAFMACAKKIRAYNASIRIHANSWSGQLGAAPIALDPKGLPLVDAFTHHTVNSPSANTFGNNTRKWAYGKPDFTNEMEYQPGSPYAGSEVGTVAAVNTFLNTLTFKDSPTGVIILHAIKPTTNAESLGYGWTWWRSTGSNASSVFPDLKEQHWTYNYWNWNSVAPFTKTVPWNSRRLNVMEDRQRVHQRVVAFETPGQDVEKGPLHAKTAAGKLIVVLTNEQAGPNPTAFNATIGTTDGKPRLWRGYSFKGDAVGKYFNVSLGTTDGAVTSFQTSLPANTVQWWYEVD